MNIELQTPLSDVNAYIEAQANAFLEAMIVVFQLAGEEVVREAREKGSYKDQTGNLRSSVGYVIVYDGQIVEESNFDQVKPTATEGGKEGREFAYKLASKFGKGLAIIVVAGMNYASYVAKNLDVLDSGELKLEELVAKIAGKLKIGLK